MDIALAPRHRACGTDRRSAAGKRCNTGLIAPAGATRPTPHLLLREKDKTAAPLRDRPARLWRRRRGPVNAADPVLQRIKAVGRSGSLGGGPRWPDRRCETLALRSQVDARRDGHRPRRRRYDPFLRARAGYRTARGGRLGDAGRIAPNPVGKGRLWVRQSGCLEHFPFKAGQSSSENAFKISILLILRQQFLIQCERKLL